MTLVQITPPPGSPSPEDLPAVDVEVAFTSRPGDAPSWRSIATGIITSLHTDRGRDSEFDDPRTGTCTVVASNRNSWLTPWNTNSPWYGLIRPGLRIRIMPRWSGVPYPLFEGYLDGFPQAYGAGLEATVSLSAGDTFKRLADIDLPVSIYELVVSIDQPTHWWKLDEETGVRSFDSGTASPPVTSIDVGAVQRGESAGLPEDGSRKAPLFGANNFIRFPAFPIAAQVTVELWAASTDLVNIGTPWSIPGAPTFTGITYNFGGAGNITVFEYGASTVTVNRPSLMDGELHHLMVVIDATGTYLYLDGALAGSSVNNDWFDAGGATYQTALGNDPQNAIANAWTGTLANLAIYNGRSLTAAQASAHYHAGADALTGETTGARVSRILDFCQVPTVDRDIDPGSSTIGAHDLSGSALSYVQTLAKTEQGRCYVSASNKVTFRSRDSIVVAATTIGTPFTLDDRGVLGPAYEDVSIPFGDDQIRNPVTVTTTRGAPQTFVDRDAVERNGPHGYGLSGLLYDNDNQSFDCAAYFVSRYKDAFERVDKIVLRPQFFPAYWATFLALEEGTPIRLVRHAPGGASTLTLDTAIEGITHDYSRDAGWTITLALSPRDLTTYWILGDTTYSQLGITTRLGF